MFLYVCVKLIFCGFFLVFFFALKQSKKYLRLLPSIRGYYVVRRTFFSSLDIFVNGVRCVAWCLHGDYCGRIYFLECFTLELRRFDAERLRDELRMNTQLRFSLCFSAANDGAWATAAPHQVWWHFLMHEYEYSLRHRPIR